MRLCLLLAGAVLLASGLLGCASVHDATPVTCPEDQRPSGGECVCISTQAAPTDGTCPPIETKCSVADCVDDANPCTEPTCIDGADTCTNEPMADDTACEDGLVVGVCREGSCANVSPRWELGAPFKIADAEDELSTPLVAVSADGHAIALWSEGDQLRSSAFDVSAGWEAPVVVEPAHVPDRGIALGMDATGNAVALYTRLQQGSIEVVAEGYSAAAGRWDSFAVISAEAAVTDTPHLSVTPEGDVAAVWWQAPDDIALARGRSDSMSWEPPLVVTADDGLQKQDPFVSIADDGHGALVYRATDPEGTGGSQSVWVAAVASDSVATPVQVSDDADWVRDPRIAAKAAGDLMVVWEEVNDLHFTRQEDDVWGSPDLVEEASDSVESPAVTVDGEGHFHVIWLQGRYVRTRRFVTGGPGWDEARVLLVSSANAAREASAAAPSNGATRVTWVQDQHVRLTRFNASSEWDSFIKVSPDIEPPALGVQGPRVDVGSDGTEVVIWADGAEIWTWADRPK